MLSIQRFTKDECIMAGVVELTFTPNVAAQYPQGDHKALISQIVFADLQKLHRPCERENW
jgi:hypothetical protein